MADSGPISGITGAITSWAGTFHGQLLTGQRPQSATLTYDAPAIDTTAFADSGIETAIPDLTAWTVSWNAMLATPAHGALGLVTFSGGYVSNLNSFTVNMHQNEIPVTAFQATTNAWIPGTLGWDGNFAGFADGTTPVVAPGAAAAAAVFRYQDLATDAELAGNIFATQLGVTSAPNQAVSVSYSYKGTAGLTSTGTAKATNTLAATAASALVFTASTGRTYSGNAFWTGISLTCAPNQATLVNVTARGTGALAIA